MSLTGSRFGLPLPHSQGAPASRPTLGFVLQPLRGTEVFSVFTPKGFDPTARGREERAHPGEPRTRRSESYCDFAASASSVPITWMTTLRLMRRRVSSD